MMNQIEITKLPNILSHIDPNLTHEEWFRVLAGVKSEFGDAGKEHALEWSRQGDSFNNGAFNASWTSANESQISFGTVIHFAQEGGFQFDKSDFTPISQQVVAERKAERDAKRQDELVQTQKKQKSAAEMAKSILSHAVPVTEHPYLTKKQLPSEGFFQASGKLIVPLYKNGELVNVQEITADGAKKFLYGGEISECSFEFGKQPSSETILICEGVATGASLFLASNCHTVVAFNSGNLPKVTKIIAQSYPDANILVCGDNDQYKDKNAGLEASKKSISELQQAHFILPDFKDTSSQPTDFNDLMVLEGMDNVTKQVEAGINELQQKIRKESLPTGFFFYQNKVFYRNPNSENEDAIEVCSQLEVIGLSRDKDQQNWSRVLEFKDLDNQIHRWSMPMEMLSADGRELRVELLNQGVTIGSNQKSKNLLKTLIQDSNVSRRFVNVSQVGWHDGVYVLPDRMFGKANEEYVLQSSSSVDIDYSCSGDLNSWKNSISYYCQNNSRLVLAISTAFAAPLISEFSIESGGVHFVGGSSLGKTTALLVAGSVWGSHKRLKKWRATGNALESVAAMSNDCLLCLDELAEMSPREAGGTAYMLANGQGKQRATKFGGSRGVQTWKLLFLSTGEISLSTHIEEAGQKARAGQAVRMVEVPAETGNFGLFDNLNGFESGSQMSEYFKERTEKYYGSAGIAFIEKFIEQKPSSLNFIKEMQDEFHRNFPEKFSSGQVNRVLNRFGFIAATGELATYRGVTGWQQGEAIRASVACFNAWLANFGGDVNSEVDQALSQVRKFIELHADSRFSDLDEEQPTRTHQRLGYKKRESGNVYYYFTTEVFRTEVCAGLDFKAVARALKETGHLCHESNRLTHKTPTLDDGRRVSAYKVSSTILDS